MRRFPGWRQVKVVELCKWRVVLLRKAEQQGARPAFIQCGQCGRRWDTIEEYEATGCYGGCTFAGLPRREQR